MHQDTNRINPSGAQSRHCVRNSTRLLARFINRAVITSLMCGAVLVSQPSAAITIPVQAWIAPSSYGAYVLPNNQGAPPVTNISLGVNAAAWDSLMLDGSYPRLLKSAGVQIVRFPGGSTADNFHWYSQSLDTTTDPTVLVAGPNGTMLPPSVSPNVTFDAFMNVVQQAGAQAMITVNYGSGTPKEAAAWVTYANMQDKLISGCCGTNAGALGAYAPTYPGNSPNGHLYGILYWEIGNEVYGNGTYGASTGPGGQHWEYDTHSTLGGTYYGQQVVAYSKAMKLADPSIKVGAVLTAPTNWPDATAASGANISQTGTNKLWNHSVLQAACSAIDFVDVHWYPQAPAGSGNGHEDDAQLLASPQHGSVTDKNQPRSSDIASMMQSLNKLIAADCGAHASAVQIFVTETNSVYSNPGRQTVSVTNALFEADDILTWLENGATNVDWWAGHNSPFDGATTNQATGAPLFGSFNFGDYGILSAGGITANGIAEPPAETPFPTYYGLQMVSNMFKTTLGWNLSLKYLPAKFLGAANTVTNNELVGSLNAVTVNGVDPGLLSIHATVAVTQGIQTFYQSPMMVANILLINKDPNNSYDVTVNDFDCSNFGGHVGSFIGPLGLTTTSQTYSYGESQINSALGPYPGWTAAPTKTFNPTTAMQPCVFEVTVPPYTMNLYRVGGNFF